jgi:hypothetical protein
MGRMGRMGRMVMGLWDEGTIVWGTMGLWDGRVPGSVAAHTRAASTRTTHPGSVAAHTCAASARTITSEPLAPPFKPAPRTTHHALRTLPCLVISY